MEKDFSKRIFLAINLPQETKAQFLKVVCQLKKELQKSGNFEKAIRWTPEPNLHLTLLFLGRLNQAQLNDLVLCAEKVSQKHQSFEIEFEKIIWAPPEQKIPRLIWAEAKENKKLENLARDLKQSVFQLPSFKYLPKEERSFKPHLTLARINQWEFKREIENNLPEIEKEIAIVFKVKSFEIMESKLKRSGAEYQILQSFHF
jgi:2'-5' RNA ligase